MLIPTCRSLMHQFKKKKKSKKAWVGVSMAYALTQGMLWFVIEIILKDTESHTVLGRRKMDSQHP